MGCKITFRSFTVSLSVMTDTCNENFTRVFQFYNPTFVEVHDTKNRTQFLVKKQTLRGVLAVSVRIISLGIHTSVGPLLN